MKWLDNLKERWSLRKEYKQRAIEKKEFEFSDEPWVSVIGKVEDKEKGLKLDLDWNDAFVKYLRSKGVPGIKDEDVVGYWVTTLHHNLLHDGDEDEF